MHESKAHFSDAFGLILFSEAIAKMVSIGVYYYYIITHLLPHTQVLSMAIFITSKVAQTLNIASI